jgi:transposase
MFAISFTFDQFLFLTINYRGRKNIKQEQKYLLLCLIKTSTCWLKIYTYVINTSLSSNLKSRFQAFYSRPQGQWLYPNIIWKCTSNSRPINENYTNKKSTLKENVKIQISRIFAWLISSSTSSLIVWLDFLGTIDRLWGDSDILII